MFAAAHGGCHAGRMDTTAAGSYSASKPSTEQVETLVAASRVLVALSVQSLGEVDEAVTLVQLRALVVLANSGPMNLSALAQHVGVHASNASRTCEALVGMGLLDRRDDASDRRNVVLAPSERGRQMVKAVFDRRRGLLSDLLANLSIEDREGLTGPLQRLVDAAGDVPAVDVWSMAGRGPA
jgi:DNA-binding MarR family transcriptional regulator